MTRSSHVAVSRRRALLTCLAALLVSSFAPPALAARTPVIVLYFDNNTGNPGYEHLSRGLADMMITELSSVPTLVVVEREKLDALLAELTLQRSKYFDARTAQKLGRGVGAAFAVTGAFISVEPDLRIDVRVVRIDSGAVVKAATVTGKKSAFFELQQRLAAQLVDGLPGVLSSGDAEKLQAASRDNRIETVDGLLEYGKGLAARDSGDLAAASSHLQKVVTGNPGFALGKTRYRQIMNELYAAKDRRQNLLADSERELLAHIDAELAKGKATSPRVRSYRILRGQYHLTRFIAASKQPLAQYREHLRAYVDNQVQLIRETRDMPRFDVGSNLESQDVKLAEELGIKQPGSTFGAPSPSEQMRRLGAVLMFGEPSIFDAPTNATERVCYYLADPSYPKVALDAFEGALAHIERHERAYRERETMRTLREYARALTALGRGEEAIAKLQSGLERFPKSDEFQDTEQMLRDILAGERLGWGCRPPN
jgi:TolB-like protein